MDALKIKYQNQTCNIICQTNHFNDFLCQLENKLKNNFFSKSDCLRAFFSFPFHLMNEQYLSLYTLCDLYHTIILGFNQKDEKCKMKLYEHCFYAGNTYYLKEETIYVGDIEADVYITTNANLYIIGNVEGTIDVLFPNLEVSGSSFDNAKIRIFDTKFHNVTNIAPCKVYYEDGKIKQS
ncbi:MAG: hypothetical protein PHQ89_05300 [Bacilli bacterium]|nr:hypothetical protein [Bacilli bacterium]